MENASEGSLERIICPRNIFLATKGVGEQAWKNLANLLISMLEKNLLSSEQVETQLLSLIRFNWDKVSILLVVSKQKGSYVICFKG